MSDATRSTQRTFIYDWSAVSPFGIGRAALSEGLRARRKAIADQCDDGAPVGLRRVPDFDVQQVLGAAGTRYLARESAMAIAAARELIEAPRPGVTMAAGRGTSMVLGTTTGTPQGYMDFTKASLEGARPHHVPAALAPNMAMNRAASASAIWYGLQGPNSTIAGGRAAGLLALSYGRRLLDHQRADQVLCGAVEENAPARSWMEYHRSRGQVTTLGEGCVLLLLEGGDPSGRQRAPLAEILALDCRFDAVGNDPVGTLEACVEGALSTAGATPKHVWAAVPSGIAGEAGDDETKLFDRLFGTAVVSRVPVASLTGDTSAASSMFAIAGMLSAAEGHREAEGRLGVVTSIDPDGSVACGVLRFLEGSWTP
ncbi:beta-ketoacyl synthase N-terminal-like domain-containing protein [Streptomyces albipurpureus]|uniref:3-oxoacyl-ACP synthase n=1 Tax=Streptomyces albipurpureus TaxID=2897419 RepID=A0ABT0UHL9_9ACTN|nr:beta-ketoacyl synthase N-terminal-like domain-containing protein [Streptomyces sp. CWNU-1]MCM2387666.1 3-oxoacyl-ACP synthase [Streptomyces sp. CWNU-1]